jgi:hypothetical protein
LHEVPDIALTDRGRVFFEMSQQSHEPLRYPARRAIGLRFPA